MDLKRKLYDVKEYDNLKDLISETCEKYADHIAFTIKHVHEKEISYQDITYQEFQKDINSLGTAMCQMGLKNKRVAIISKNRYEWVVGYISVLNGVGIAIPLDKGLPDNEIELSLIRSQADVILFEKSYIDTIKKIQRENKTMLKHYICMDEVSELSILSMPELLEKGRKLLEEGKIEYLDATVDPDAMSIILFTSGTTSQSKAVMLSHRNIASNIYAINAAEKFYDTDVNLAFLPFHHTFGSTGILFFLSNGAKNVFCDGLRHIQNNVKEYKVSTLVCVPLLIETMYKKIWQAIEKKGKTKTVKKAIKISNILSKVGINIQKKLFKEIHDNFGGNLRMIISGASGLDKEVAKGFNDLGILTIQGYGLTETSPVLCAENLKVMKPGSCGVPLCNVELKIDDPDEHGVGEIVVKGPNVMAGYYENQEATEEVLKDGWFYTGDLAYIDQEGYLFITGRKKNVIVLKNGKNIYPEELETLINQYPYVKESLVFGFPKKGDLILSAKIVYQKEYIDEFFQGITQEELKEKIWKDIKEINKNLANYKHIKNIIITDEEMIKTTTAKIKRFEEIKKITFPAESEGSK